MKLLTSIPIVIVTFCNHVLAGDGIVTLTASPGVTNEVQITASQSFKVLNSYDNGGVAHVTFLKDSKVFDYLAGNSAGVVMAGPAVVRLGIDAGVQPTIQSFVTLEVRPAPFPPGKTVTVGAYSGNVQVTMEMSTDLVNWTPAVNAMVYTNSPDARFFRIKLVTNATP